MKIDLIYNPYFQSTKLYMDKTLYKNTKSRLFHYLSTPIENWISNKNESYKSWGGFFVELVEELNDDSFAFVFHGTREHFDIVKQSFENQKKGVEDRGFNSGGIKVEYINDFSVSELKERFNKFIRAYKDKLRTQLYMEKMGFIEHDIQEISNQNYEEYLAIFNKIAALFTYAKKEAVDKVFWDEALDDLKKMYGEKGA